MYNQKTFQNPAYYHVTEIINVENFARIASKFFGKRKLSKSTYKYVLAMHKDLYCEFHMKALYRMAMQPSDKLTSQKRRLRNNKTTPSRRGF